MSSSSTSPEPGTSVIPENLGDLPVALLVVIVLFALVAIVILIAGARRARRRKQADHELAEHAEQAGVERPSPDATPIDESKQELEQAALFPPDAPAQQPRSPEPPRDLAPRDDQPVAAAAPMEAGPADGPLTQLKGVGPKLATRLAELGFATVGQIAALTDAQADRLDAQLGAFSGRIARDRWIEQARFLAAGDRAGFEAVFGRL